ncbi:LysR family transcriptional regulator [Spongiactinospora gelatinilytica]|uniref:LysR family transcriptional regulator n=1 Tax=Spongiactinospora gelatinilytica TaxID=2666298 RepID=A0A2W2H049_9ACTN|nr:LysR family transcriptional regulator [Spongiactinospora gelatinilytica]PZG32444.1 LysR family transcriptional regulator [Spongiactinospora gelatinilytica]
MVVPEGADLDLAAVRAFIAVTEEQYFSEAATRLGITQQAISKRIARLEADLGVRLFLRSRNGAGLTTDGRAFLPHARALMSIADQALQALRDRSRRLRVDVLDTRLASLDLVRDFHQTIDGADVEIITSDGLRSARGTLPEGTIDAAFARAAGPLADGLRATPAYLEANCLIVGLDHPLAAEREVSMERLSGVTVWMPGNAPGSEWGEYYRLLGAEFDVRIDTSGPDFGWEHYVAEIVAADRIGLAGERCRLPWHPRTVQIPLVNPCPVYPTSLLWHHQNHHPLLRSLIRFIKARFRPYDPAHEWLPISDRPAFTPT